MSMIRAVARLDAHEVFNQPPPLEDGNRFTGDRALATAVCDAFLTHAIIERAMPVS